MLRISFWIIAAVVAVGATVLVSFRVQESLNSSFPYPEKTASIARATRQQLIENLGREPLQAAVLRELSVREKAQSELLELSQKVSRRDPIAQLLLIENSTDKGDIEATLKHYAVLLVISPGLRRNIIDLLGTAARDPEIFSALAAHKDRAWFPAVMTRMVATIDTGEAFLDLLKATPSVKAALKGPEQVRPLFMLMLDKPDPYHAFALMDELRAINPALARFGFSVASLDERLAPFTWRLGRYATLMPADNKGLVALQVTAAPNIRTNVAERFTDLKVGTYRFTGIVQVHNSPRLQLQMAVRCKDKTGSNEIIMQTISPAQNGEKFDLSVTVPAQCFVQHWDIAILGDDARLPSIVTLSQFHLDAVDQRAPGTSEES